MLLDPIFPMTFLVGSWIPGFLDAILQATFLCALLMFWLCMYHGLRQVKCKMNYLSQNTYELIFQNVSFRMKGGS